MSAFRHFVSAESLIAVLARRIGIDPNDLAYQWQIENGEVVIVQEGVSGPQHPWHMNFWEPTT